MQLSASNGRKQNWSVVSFFVLCTRVPACEQWMTSHAVDALATRGKGPMRLCVV